jgi:hypothetical protein
MEIVRKILETSELSVPWLRFRSGTSWIKTVFVLSTFNLCKYGFAWCINLGRFSDDTIQKYTIVQSAIDPPSLM